MVTLRSPMRKNSNGLVSHNRIGKGSPSDEPICLYSVFLLSVRIRRGAIGNPKSYSITISSYDFLLAANSKS